MLFAQFLPLRIGGDRNMGIFGMGQAKQLLQVKLPRSGFEQVVTPHYPGNLLPRIINHNGQLVGCQAIAAAYYEVTTV